MYILYIIWICNCMYICVNHTSSLIWNTTICGWFPIKKTKHIKKSIVVRSRREVVIIYPDIVSSICTQYHYILDSPSNIKHVLSTLIDSNNICQSIFATSAMIWPSGDRLTFSSKFAAIIRPANIWLFETPRFNRQLTIHNEHISHNEQYGDQSYVKMVI